MKPCDVPPVGWRCTRAAGHCGPCAAVCDILERADPDAGFTAFDLQDAARGGRLLGCAVGLVIGAVVVGAAVVLAIVLEPLR